MIILLGLLVVLASLTFLSAPAASAQPPIAPPATSASPSQQPIRLSPAEIERFTRSSLIVVPSVVGTVTITMDGQTEEIPITGVFGLCTGWFKDQLGYIGTAGHCGGKEVIAENLQKDLDESFRNFGPMTPDSPTTPKAVVNIDTLVIEVVQPLSTPRRIIPELTTVRQVAAQTLSQGDNALLKLDGMEGLIDVEPITLADTKPQIGDSVLSIGYTGTALQEAIRPILPGSEIGPISDETIQNLPNIMVTPSFDEDEVIGHRSTREGTAFTEVGTKVNPGMSGGLTINADRDGVGINSQVINDLQTTALVTDTRNLHDFMSSNSPAGTPEAAAPSQTDQSPATPATNAASTAPADDGKWSFDYEAVLIVGIGVPLAIGIAAYAIGRVQGSSTNRTRRSRHQAPAPSAETDETAVQEDRTDTETDPTIREERP